MVEASLYAIRLPYIRQLVETGHRSGQLLMQFKEKMDYPISAILIFDTLLGVGGAAIAGSQAQALFGPDFALWFSIGLSASLLLVSQIIPKILGVVYSKAVARTTAAPVSLAISILYPVVWTIERFTRHLQPDEPQQKASEEEVMQMAMISAEEGSILGVEAELIQNSLKLNEIHAAEIMTDLCHVVALASDMTVKDAVATFHDRLFSRIPIFDPQNKNQWIGIVMSRDILYELANDREDTRLISIARHLHCVPVNTPGHILLDAFLKRRSHLFGVNDRKGNAVGVVSLKDVIEEILGKEIADERETKLDLT